MTEKHKAIWVWMGDKAPDHSKIPDFSVMDNVPELHATKLDKIMVKANVELIIDNLLDLSHTSFLHAGILGNADTVESDIGVEQEGDDIVVSRYARAGEPPGMNKLMWPDVPAKVDKFTRIRWMAPSTLRLVTGVCRPGETPEQGSGYHAVHILTPETDQTTHYFFTAVRFGIFSKGDELNRQIQEKVAATRRFAFEDQDAPVIEAQQRIIDASQTSVDPLILAIDVGPVRYKQVLKKLIAAESRAGIEAPVTGGLARLIAADLPLDDWVALVRTTVPPPARFRRGPARPRPRWWARLRARPRSGDASARPATL